MVASIAFDAEVRRKYDKLHSCYESRLASLSECIESIKREVLAGDATGVLASDPSSAHYLAEHAADVISEGLLHEREGYIKLLAERLSEAEAESESGRIKVAELTLKLAEYEEKGSLRDEILELKQEYQVAIEGAWQEAEALRQDNESLAEQSSNARAQLEHVVIQNGAAARKLAAANELVADAASGRAEGAEAAAEAKRLARCLEEQKVLERRQLQELEAARIEGGQLSAANIKLRAQCDALRGELAQRDARIAASAKVLSEREASFRAAAEKMERLMEAAEAEQGTQLAALREKAGMMRERLMEEVRKARRVAQSLQKELRAQSLAAADRVRGLEDQLRESRDGVRQGQSAVGMEQREREQQARRASENIQELAASKARVSALERQVSELSQEVVEARAAQKAACLEAESTARAALSAQPVPVPALPIQPASASLPGGAGERILASRLEEALTNISHLKAIAERESSSASRLSEALKEESLAKSRAVDALQAENAATARALEGQRRAESELAEARSFLNNTRSEMESLRQMVPRLEELGESSLTKLAEKEQQVERLSGDLAKLRHQLEQQRVTGRDITQVKASVQGLRAGLARMCKDLQVEHLHATSLASSAMDEVHRRVARITAGHNRAYGAVEAELGKRRDSLRQIAAVLSSEMGIVLQEAGDGHGTNARELGEDLRGALRRLLSNHEQEVKLSQEGRSAAEAKAQQLEERVKELEGRIAKSRRESVVQREQHDLAMVAEVQRINNEGELRILQGQLDKARAQYQALVNEARESTRDAVAEARRAGERDVERLTADAREQAAGLAQQLDTERSRCKVCTYVCMYVEGGCPCSDTSNDLEGKDLKLLTYGAPRNFELLDLAIYHYWSCEQVLQERLLQQATDMQAKLSESASQLLEAQQELVKVKHELETAEFKAKCAEKQVARLERRLESAGASFDGDSEAGGRSPLSRLSPARRRMLSRKASHGRSLTAVPSTHSVLSEASDQLRSFAETRLSP
ncbi:unnamed protein product [Chrysoparadoxa australica]